MPEPATSPEPWHAVLDGLLAWGGTQDAARSGRAALQLEVRELTPRTRDRWNGPTSRAAGRRAPADGAPGSGELRLGARPVVRTTRGWARAGLTWSNLPHLQERLDLDDAQHRWLCQLGALHRAGRPPRPGDDPGWLFLDDFVNPVLWELLAQADALGLPLVGASARAVVRVGARAAVGIDAARVAGGIRLGARVTVDDVAVPVRHAHPVGTHGVWVADPTRPRDVVLAPVAEPLTPQHLALLGAAGGRTVGHALGAGVVVPDHEAPAFLAEHLPALRAGMEVTSADGTVDLPPPAPPTLVLTATHSPGHVLDLAWRWDAGRAAAPAPDPRRLLAGVVPEEWWPRDPAGGPAPAGVLPRRLTLRDVDAAEAATTVLPRLAGLPGVRVDVVGDAPAYRELRGTPVLTVTAQPTEQNDWFDLGVTVTLEGRTVPFVPLFTALAKGRRRLLLVDHTYLSLDHPALQPLVELIAEARDLAEWETGLRISRHQTSLWEDLAGLADEAEAAPAWQALLAEAQDPAGGTVPLPAGLQAELRPYQAEGFRWLTFLWRHRVGGVLADDMGLGKTVQTLALVQHAVEQRGPTEPRRPFLVVAPTSVVPNWVAEAARFTPGLTVRRVAGTEATAPVPLADVARGADVVVTSYALLRLDADAYAGVASGDGWAGVVLDEAQQVKNAASRGHRAVRDLGVPFTLAVTGTPVENSLTELHALLALTTPGLLPSARRFAEQYVRPVEGVHAGISTGPGAGDLPASAERLRSQRLDRLRRRVRPFLLRRTKDLVAADLPDRQEQTLAVELSPEHRAVYDRYLQLERQKVLGLVDDLDRQRFIVYRSLTLLRMLALDASLVDPALAGVPSAKTDALVEQIADVVAEGHRALVFSQFTSYLALVAERLTGAGVEHAYLDGSTTRREEVVDGFRTGDAPVFLLSLRAGGTGLNLTEADYVFLLDPWWNPAVEQQAVDRAHRIGQHRTVMVYRLIAAGTIEEKVVALQRRKAALVDAVVDDGDLFAAAVTAAEVRELLG
ncbi:DEAD/DEAH box helicase [Cellulomonas sp. C5510]|uniref:DEAD/DEAH box helicase n=1 Tax=Cellulomonas sp. C5510 TaxID=2871170 RepID=UPI001C986588|nr:DEAD/DEAH box helicase [Cellulomonas sp. C5510]QZN85471.1 DEAD/DEAH box helicase [Cellulomonas sp. C5510]